jgi:hypothetical protein
VGFYAAANVGMLELKRSDKDGKYYGSFWADYGPLPVELTREGDIARGTVSYGGVVRPLQLESTSDGLIVIIDGKRAKTALHYYTNRQEYERTLVLNGGPAATSVEVTTQP